MESKQNMTLSHIGIQTAGCKFGNTMLTVSALVESQHWSKLWKEWRFSNSNFKEIGLRKDPQLTSILKKASKRK